MRAGGARGQVPRNMLAETARKYVGQTENGRISDPTVRDKVIQFAMDQRSLSITQKKARDENTSGATPGEATSIFKLYGATLGRDTANFRVELMGSQGYGWEGASFSENELEAARTFLSSRAITIYGGTNEIQMNIVAKRVLGLPD